MDERDKALIAARLEILRLRHSLRTGATHGSKTAIDDELVVAYAARTLQFEASIYEVQPPFSVQTLRRWAADFRKHGIESLRDGRDGHHRRGKNTVTADPRIESAFLSILLDRPSIKATHLAQMMEEICVQRALPVPSRAAIGRCLREWKDRNPELFEQLRNPDAFRSKYLRALGTASEQIRHKLQLIELDDSPADLIFRERRRANLAFGIDVFTRRAIAIVSETANTDTVKLLLRRIILEWGVPDEILTDNGANYTSKETILVCHQLDIARRLAPPFSPEKKPHVERLIGTFQHSLFVEGLSSYIGHDVAKRQELRARRNFALRLAEPGETELNMTLEQFQESLDQWCINYNNTVHSTTGESPMARWASDRRIIKEVRDERALDELLAPPAGKSRYTIQKDGVRVQGATYICAELGAFDIGTEVRVLLDPADLGRVVLYRAKDGAFIGVAEDPTRTGIDRSEVAAHAKAIQKQRMREQRAALRAMHRDARINVDDVIRDMLRTKALDGAKVVSLDAQRVAHDTPALQAGAAAAKAKHSPDHGKAQPPSKKVRDAVRRGEKVLEAPTAALPRFTNDVERHQYWKHLHGQVTRGEALPPPLEEFYHAWQRSGGFELFSEMERDAESQRSRQNAGR